MPSFVNPGFSKRATVNGSLTSETPSEGVHYGRVIDVILDSSHPRYKEMGGSQALYGVFYQPLFERTAPDFEDADLYSLRFAYCQQATLRQIPVRTEIVTLEENLSVARIETKGEFTSNRSLVKTYWTSIVPVWNHPHVNVYPDVIRMGADGEENIDFGPDFEEDINVKPLQLNTGDVSLEGRHGQSLRFGGTKSSFNELTTKENNGKPFTILRNGQAPTKGDVCIEDINKDDASIYLTSDHKVPLVEASHKFAGAKKVPPLARDYQGKQIVANADQIVINAREDDMMLAAKNHLGGNAKTVSFDGEDYLGLDADKVYLGTHAQRELNPVLKGQETIDFLEDIIGTIQNFTETLSKLPPEPYSWVTTATLAAGAATMSLKSIMVRIKSLLSKKVYTE